MHASLPGGAGQCAYSVVTAPVAGWAEVVLADPDHLQRRHAAGPPRRTPPGRRLSTDAARELPSVSLLVNMTRSSVVYSNGLVVQRVVNAL